MSHPSTIIVGLLALLSSNLSAADWPQWRGPNRDGISKETGLLKEWPQDGPKLIWQVKDLGGGYATPSVAGGRIYIDGEQGDRGGVGQGPRREGRQPDLVHAHRQGRQPRPAPKLPRRPVHADR